MPADYTKWKRQFNTASDALRQHEPTPYLIDQLLPLPSLTMFYGIAGSLKTNLVLDMAVCVATGTRWLTELPDASPNGYAVDKSPVVWIDVDSGQRVLSNRIGAMLRTRKAKPNIPFYYASFLVPPFITTDTKSSNYLVSLIKDFKARLVVFDNLGTISGNTDENSNQMVGVMSCLRGIAESTESAVVVIHHDTKYDNGNRKTPRGHSSIEAALDAALWVKREDDTVSIVPTKMRNEPIDPFAALWSWEPEENSRQLREARFYGMEGEIDEKSRQADEAICVALRHGPMTQGEILEECKQYKISKGKCLSRLQALEHKHKIIVKIGQAHNRKTYSLPR